MAGRKSLREEIEAMRRYADLAEPYFTFLKACLEGDDKADKKWAGEQLSKAFTRMIPTVLEGSGENGEIVTKIINYVGANSTSQFQSQTLPDSVTASS